MAEAMTQSSCVEAFLYFAGTSVCLVFLQPLLTSYEAHVLFEEASWTPGQYPMDFYSKGSGPWTNYYEVCTPQGRPPLP